jgi:Transposase DDE domain
VLSLLTTAVWTVGLGLGDLSRQAIDKRIHKSTAWLNYLLSVLLKQVVEVPSQLGRPGGRLVLRDASVISRPGSPGTAAEARDKVRPQARKNKRGANPKTLLAADFCLLLTNLPTTTWPTLAVLACYRIRWQIEWCFRRWKSLCQLDVLPAFPTQIAEPVLLAKLIIILLMQQRLASLPWREWWADQQPAPVVSPIVQMTYQRLCEIIRPVVIIDHLLSDPKPFLRHLRSSRRKRPLQLADATRSFAGLLVGLSPGPAG